MLRTFSCSNAHEKGHSSPSLSGPKLSSSPIFFHSLSSLTTANFLQVPEDAIFASIVPSPGMRFSSLFTWWLLNISNGPLVSPSLWPLPWTHLVVMSLFLSGAQHCARPPILALSSSVDITGSTFLLSPHSSPCAPWAGTSEVENWHSCWAPTSSPVVGSVSAYWVNEWLCCFVRDA